VADKEKIMVINLKSIKIFVKYLKININQESNFTMNNNLTICNVGSNIYKMIDHENFYLEKDLFEKRLIDT
jgi:hypothetical protein